MILFPGVMIQLFHRAYHGEMIRGIFHMVSAATCVSVAIVQVLPRRTATGPWASHGAKVCLHLTWHVFGLKQK